MKKIAVLFSNGTEEIEALTPVDVLRRAGVECDIVSVCGEFPKGSHGITVKADKLIEEIHINDYDGIVIPGGLPGAQIIADNDNALKMIKTAVADGKMVAAICAAPALGRFPVRRLLPYSHPMQRSSQAARESLLKVPKLQSSSRCPKRW